MIVAKKTKKRSPRSGSSDGKGGNKNRLRDQFVDRIKAIFDCSKDEALRLTSQPLRSSIRINTLSALSRDEILKRLADFGAELEPISWCDDAFHLLSDKRELAASPLFQDGHVYIMNASSLIPVLALEPQPGERILDVCAAPGGKSAYIAAQTNNQCELHLNDAMAPRIKKLEEVVGMFNVKAASISNFQGQFIDREFDEQFDRILLDAQCSGEGMLDLDHPSAMRYWSLAKIEKNAFLQQKLLRAAFDSLKPGGVLVYSTCTFAPEENEAPVSRLLKIRDTARLEPIELDIPEAMPGLRSWQGLAYHSDIQHAMRIRPSGWLEGFFACRIRKAT